MDGMKQQLSGTKTRSMYTQKNRLKKHTHLQWEEKNNNTIIIHLFYPLFELRAKRRRTKIFSLSAGFDIFHCLIGAITFNWSLSHQPLDVLYVWLLSIHSELLSHLINCNNRFCNVLRCFFTASFGCTNRHYPEGCKKMSIDNNRFEKMSIVWKRPHMKRECMVVGDGWDQYMEKMHPRQSESNNKWRKRERTSQIKNWTQNWFGLDLHQQHQ